MSSTRRILLFYGANEASGTAILYRMLQQTKHPLEILYMARYTNEGAAAAHYLKKNPRFLEALTKSRSRLQSLQIFPVRTQTDTSKIESFFERYARSHGAHPISYLFLNGNPNYGEQVNQDESPDQREARLSKNWAPWSDALTKCPPRDHDNQFDNQNPYLTAKNFISHMTIMLATLLPYVRRDGEGTVVLKTPTRAKLQTIRSRNLRMRLMNPTPANFESAVHEVRSAAAMLANKKFIENSSWPEKRFFKGLGDFYARSALTLYKSFSLYESIAFHTTVHNPRDLDEPVRLLLDPLARDIQTFQFTDHERQAARKSYATDIGVPSLSSKTGLFRRLYETERRPPVKSWVQVTKSIEERFPKKAEGLKDPSSVTIRPVVQGHNGPRIGESIFCPVYPDNNAAEPPLRNIWRTIKS
ncbi:hypothetical protein Dda_8936 [Drechslerella dactyloides]|uniref:Uncharacterized protein n=1 Tax=Drechslerella dactyloides TaxID=74499 RepID=A0AAD6NFK8_DREDA|nr:hypothetical protein Dda_8936 [Drechslerella dactyloides]